MYNSIIEFIEKEMVKCAVKDFVRGGIRKYGQ